MFKGAQHFMITGGNFEVVNQAGEGFGFQLLHQKAIHGATHDSAERYPPPKCHPGTRKTVTKEIISWVEDRSRASGAVWLHGPAGAGKTAIAQDICEYCLNEGYLAGSFFFSRTTPGRNTVINLFTTIAYQIAMTVPGARKILDKTITNDPAVVDKAFQIQLSKLIVDPLRKLCRPGQRAIIVIDGLDECEGENLQCHILRILGLALDGGITLPSFIISSRPESWIRDEFNREGPLFRHSHRISLEQSDETDDDIRSFFKASFASIHQSSTYRYTMSDVPKPWPSDDVLDKLVDRASGQFIYPATVIKFVSDPDCRPTERLQLILDIPTKKMVPQSNPLADLDELYKQILSTCRDVQLTLRVLGAVLVLRDPSTAAYRLQYVPAEYSLTITERLLGLQRGDGYLSLRFIHSLVKVADLPHDVNQHIEEPVVFYHRSFVDFLLDKDRSHQYFINLKTIHCILALACLAILRGVKSETGTWIRYLLWGYSNFYWMKHMISSGQPNTECLDALRDFNFHEHFLHAMPTFGLTTFDLDGYTGAFQGLRSPSQASEGILQKLQ
ncbi:hypothetical protein CPC08DRAFT_110311 [Agrocybe pediades]|nr:hypothetical protein CPC08DRAFT_110311 [Agrocybe pediades]